jgi:hypothetical protein
MSGIVSIATALYEKVSGKTLRLACFLILGSVCFFFAFYGAWDEQYQKAVVSASKAQYYQRFVAIKQETINQLTAKSSPLETNQPKTGDANTFYGGVPKGSFGSGNVVILPDKNGNINIQSGAYGSNAHAGPNSVAVGANAGAGTVSPVTNHP